MREIKFRAWHKKNRSLLPIGFVDWLTNKVGVTNLPSISEYDDMSEYILMQYTGLKDKNGKEIYEGDIVRARELHMDSEVVFRSEGYINNYYLPTLVIGLSDGVVEDLKLEVIGNIYENPDLIKNSPQD